MATAKKVVVTENDLLEALRKARQEASEEDGGYLTSTEMADRLGVSDKTVYRLLHKIAAQDQLEHTRVRRQSPLTGRWYTTDGYRLKADD